MKSFIEIPVEDLRAMFEYLPDTGDLIWKCDRQKKFTGSKAGHVEPSGHLRVGIRGRYYLVHRVCWAIYHGSWPEQFIDHANGKPDDNRIVNLRQATRWQNNSNQKLSRKNKLGLKGVHFHRVTGKYAAKIKHRGRSRHLGVYVTPEEAHEVYSLAAEMLFGDFCRESSAPYGCAELEHAA
ncbi:HNH endonuclease [Bordetella genomosp. 4]|uniref:AP2/ERF domain-containing protein n=1 Tax=Bordetella genomosp. 4 TaxID=463044 RepID=A0A261U581_9BORD|nr:HNH endonuclease [Bordetella genomosp. 4]OZI56775.1 hypothetical protein CAL20_15360 [Bordetella genomosp. 4]